MIDLIYSLMCNIDFSRIKVKHRHNSFSPIFKQNKVDFFINGFGENYFEKLYEFLLKAKHEVYINDWWLSP